MKSLFDPIDVGAIAAKNRIFMAPMTRARGTKNHVPTNMMVPYYASRASAGIIISEAIGISQEGLGWPFATGLWDQQQIDGWRKITDAVHEAGGKIIAQLWHMGRVVHTSFLNGAQPVSSSTTTAPGLAYTYQGRIPYPAARALSEREIKRIVSDFRVATKNALKAGFDGVQIHAANGYLLDQFIRDSANFRTDAYGGSIENRLRFMLEVTEAVAEIAGADRTGIRLSTTEHSQGIRDSDPEPLFIEAFKRSSAMGIAHIELREPAMDGTFGRGERPPLAPILRPHFNGVLIRNADFNYDSASLALAEDSADAISFGRYFITNPDLPWHFKDNIQLIPEDRETWFTQGEQGYNHF